MVSIDLESGVTAEQRKAFNEAMKDEKWSKLPDVTTLWTASFTDGATVNGIVDTAKSDVASSARKAKVLRYHAVVGVCEETPTPFKNS